MIKLEVVMPFENYTHRAHVASSLHDVPGNEIARARRFLKGFKIVLGALGFIPSRSPRPGTAKRGSGHPPRLDRCLVGKPGFEPRSLFVPNVVRDR